MLAVCPDFDLGYGQRLRAETSTFLHHRQASQSGCGKSLLPPLAGCRQNLTHLSDIMLQKVFVQGVRDLQPADEHDCGDVLITVEDLGQLALKVANIRFKDVALPHVDGEKVVVVLLSLPARCVLGKKHFGHLLKVVERMRRQKVELI